MTGHETWPGSSPYIELYIRLRSQLNEDGREGLRHALGAVWYLLLALPHRKDRQALGFQKLIKRRGKESIMKEGNGDGAAASVLRFREQRQQSPISRRAPRGDKTF